MVLLALLVAACGRRDSNAGADGGEVYTPPPYAGADSNGIPHYTTRTFTPEERALLLHVYGVEDPGQLYVSDSTNEGLLEYDSKAKSCKECFVNSYLIGFVSIRRPGESWDALERRVRAMRPADFPASARTAVTSTAALDPAVRSDVERMLADAARAGFHLRVLDTYRSPEREAWLMSLGRGRTYTLTSLHSYGRAIDVRIGDGNINRATTRKEWIAFRRWVTAYGRGQFRVMGTPARTWDWSHVEVPSAALGFRTIDDALARARACSSDRTPRVPCDFAPHLPAMPRPATSP